MRGTPWTLADITEAIRMRQRGKLDFDVIAERLGRTVNAVRAKLCQMDRFVITGNDTVPLAAAEATPEQGGGRGWRPSAVVPELMPAQARTSVVRAALAAEIAAAHRESPELRPYREAV